MIKIVSTTKRFFFFGLSIPLLSSVIKINCTWAYIHVQLIFFYWVLFKAVIRSKGVDQQVWYTWISIIIIVWVLLNAVTRKQGSWVMGVEHVGRQLVGNFVICEILEEMIVETIGKWCLMWDWVTGLNFGGISLAKASLPLHCCLQIGLEFCWWRLVSISFVLAALRKIRKLAK